MWSRGWGQSHTSGRFQVGELCVVGSVVSRNRKGSDLCFKNIPLAEKGVKERKHGSRIAMVQAGHEGGWTGWPSSASAKGSDMGCGRKKESERKPPSI